MRITGLATGLDMDEIVKSSMQPYRIKIQVQQQQKEILEIKQKLYRDVIQDSRDFYNKYFDVSKSDSILLSKNWNTVGFSSSSDAVTVTATNGSKPGNYTITGTTATAAKAVVGTNDIGNEIVVNGKNFTIEGTSGKEKAENLNKQLKEAGINVSVRYSDMAGTVVGSDNNKSGFIFESTVLGKDGTFTIGGTTNVIGISESGTNSTAATITGISMDQLLGSGVNIDGKDIKVELPVKEGGEEVTLEEKITAINNALKDSGLKVSADESDSNKIIITSTTLGKIADDKIPVIKITSVEVGNFENGKDATAATTKISEADVNGKISINGKMIDLTSKKDTESNVEYINRVLKEQGAGITATIDADNNIILTCDKSGEGTITVSKITGDTSDKVSFTEGTDASIVIKDDNGGVYTHEGSSNTITLDGVTFNFTGKISAGEEIKITGKNDVTAVKDKLVNFINDYNTVMVKLNTLLTEKRDRSYVPLTDEQKEAMSESEIKLWDEKVKKGQLKGDSDLTRIANGMKSAMRTFMEGNNLQKFGIEPVADYQGTSNGTFTIDEDKLVSALENNPEEVMNLFIGTNEDKSKSGIAQQLKSILYDETVTTSATLLKKAGMEGSATSSNNELTKKINKYVTKMEDLETDFSRREQALYSKWATIETMMNNLNSQQSSLSSLLGS